MTAAPPRPLHLVERAFQLAMGGECRTVTEIKAKLRKEGYAGVGIQLEGRSLRAQLRHIMISGPPKAQD